MYDNPNKTVKYNVQHILPAMIIVSLGNRACVDTRGEDIWEEERVGRGGRKGKRGEREEEVREGCTHFTIGEVISISITDHD